MTVHLVGAGPGDPGLITVRGLELIRRCEAIVYDDLVSEELVDEAPADALRISRRGMKQAAVNDLIVELGLQGLDVVRLKGGDPFVFGRGGEEALVLAAAGIEFDVVAGVSAMASVPGSFLIPITHRGVSAQVTLVSGQSAFGDDLPLETLAKAPGTLVVFMGLGNLDMVSAGLITHGRDAHTPAAVISNGTLPNEKIVTGTLRDIAARAATEDLPSPALFVVGDVIAVGDYVESVRVSNRPGVAAS